MHRTRLRGAPMLLCGTLIAVIGGFTTAPPTTAAPYAIAGAVWTDAGCAVWGNTAVCFAQLRGLHGSGAGRDPVVAAYGGTPGASASTHGDPNHIFLVRGDSFDSAPLGASDVVVSPWDGTVEVHSEVGGCAIDFTLHRTEDQGLAPNAGHVFLPRGPHVNVSVVAGTNSPMYGYGGTCNEPAGATTLAFASSWFYAGAAAGDSEEPLSVNLGALERLVGRDL